MSRDIANHKAKVVASRRNEPKISANRSHRLIERLDQYFAPGQSAGSEALLHACREQQVFFDFVMALFELSVGFAQRVFGALLFGNVRGRNHRKRVAVGVLDLPRGNQHRQFSPVALRQEEFVLTLTFCLPSLDVLHELRDILGWKQFCDESPHKFFRGHPDHLQEQPVREDHPAAMIIDDHALIQRLQNAFHFIDPLMLRVVQISLRAAQSQSKFRCSNSMQSYGVSLQFYSGATHKKWALRPANSYSVPWTSRAPMARKAASSFASRN